MKRTSLAMFGVLALVGCGSSRSPAVSLTPTVTDSIPRSHHTFHSASQHYSVRQVERAFADQGVGLRDVPHRGLRRTLRFLDGRPTHQVFVYVSLKGCKCAFAAAIPHARETHHGNLSVLWRAAEGPAVRAALRELR